MQHDAGKDPRLHEFHHKGVLAAIGPQPGFKKTKGSLNCSGKRLTCDGHAVTSTRASKLPELSAAVPPGCGYARAKVMDIAMVMLQIVYSGCVRS